MKVKGMGDGDGDDDKIINSGRHERRGEKRN